MNDREIDQVLENAARVAQGVQPAVLERIATSVHAS
jgi:hypothetical protein